MGLDLVPIAADWSDWVGVIVTTHFGPVGCRDIHAFFGSPEEDASDSEISCENGCNVSEQRRCKTCVPVSGSLPNAGWQISDLLLLLDHWVQLLLLLGHQGERGLGASKEEEDSLNPQTRCQEERRAFEEEAQYFNCDFL